MNKLLTFIFISISIACWGQPPKEQPKKSFDSTLVLNSWHLQQLKLNNAEIKRLGGTTIEAEQQRLTKENQLIINSFIATKILDLSRIENVVQPSEEKIVVTLKPKK